MSFQISIERDGKNPQVQAGITLNHTLDDLLAGYAARHNLNKDHFRVFQDRDELNVKDQKKKKLSELGLQGRCVLRIIVTENRITKKLHGVEYELTNKIACFITLEAEDDVYNVILPCGHVISPNGLKGLVQSIINGEFDGVDIICTAVLPMKDSDKAVCGAPIPYQNLRELAELSDEECKEFEYKLSNKALRRDDNIKACLKCKTFMIKSGSGNKVHCSVCYEKDKKITHICWLCLRPWVGKTKDYCGNPDCRLTVGEINAILASTPKFDIHAQKCKNVYSRRLCPACGTLNEHDQQGKCKHIKCANAECTCEFCLVCLKILPQGGNWASVCGGYWDMCPTGLAPLQTKDAGENGE